MNRRTWIVLAALAVAAFWTTTAGAAVRVVEDEVVFTLKAPEAEAVFLVGDFNNWNPTVEPMDETDGTFGVSLFLVEGTYHYKFVVDGVWMADPDNPARTDKGSVFTLEERAGGYALSTDEPEPQTRARAVTPQLRYIGLFTREGDDHDTRQIADLFLDVERPHLVASVDFQSLDPTWKWSPPSADVDVFRARVQAKAGMWTVTGFENDSTWTSRGPVTLVGRDGVFDYNAGFERHGVAAELAPSSFFLVRGFYADHATTSASPPASIAVAGFAAGAAPDTTAYAYAPSTRDADQAAFELVIDSGDIDVGYVRRFDRGLHPGVLADIARAGATLPTAVYATRESRDVTLYWARLRDVFGFGVTLGYGRGSSDIDIERQARVETEPASLLTAESATGDADACLPLLASDRATVELDRHAAAAVWNAWWDYVTLDFDPAASAGAVADVHRAGVGAGWTHGGWNARFDARYTDQRYRGTPADVHVDSPARNVWPYGRDEFTVADLVELGADRYTDGAASLEWTAPATAAPWVPGTVRARVAAVTDGAFGGVSLLEATAGAEFKIHRWFHASADGRLASYDRAAWNVNETFLSGWIEVGYRRAFVDVNIGYGFDPVVFDPVANEFQDIGWQRWLRRSIGDGVRRDDARGVGERMIALERELEAAGVIKLECTIRF